MMTATPAAIASMELLSFDPQSPRADDSLAAFARAGRASGVPVQTSRSYRGGADLLVLWGPGHPARFDPMRRQIAAGGHVCALDLAYWHRDRKVRISIDGAHPQGWVMRRHLPRSRFAGDAVRVSDVWNPDGPVIVAGLGEKARVQYGATVIDAWEAAMMAEARRRGKVVQYRAKRSAMVPIDQALIGASLVITWHSNVAVDAIRLGIPVICQDGAASAICASTWTDDLKPLPVPWRDRFLANLAWFQWDLDREAAACLAFLQEALA